MGYDYSSLNDREFEALGASIIEKTLSKRVEVFKSGRDGGVDGRFWLGSREGVLQCKHWMSTPYPQLISKLKKEEKDKVHKLSPESYIFITSQSLSRENKREIKEIFHPHIKRQSDIWGKEDLNRFLSKKENQDVVEENYKLWIVSTLVLDTIFNHAIKGRSDFELEEIRERCERYVLTQNHSKAIKILEDKNVVIITGEPGIGKSTLSENLVLHYVAKGYKFYKIASDISEAENVYRQEEKIVFYRDDFLGSNFEYSIGDNRDSQLTSFIKRIQKDRDKKFILNSRTNIINGAIEASHIFQNDNLRKDEFRLTIDKSTDLDKAKILYSHMYYSNLNPAFIDEIYKDKRYKKIIGHKNFNPRIVEFILDDEKLLEKSPDKYWGYVWNRLENPQDVWKKFFKNLDDHIKSIVFLITFNGGRISEDLLKESFRRYKKIHGLKASNNNFQSFITVAMKSVINRHEVKDGKFEYTLYNPSLADYILNNYKEEVEIMGDVLKALKTKESLRYLSSFSTSKILEKNFLYEVQLDLFNYFFDKGLKNKEWDYLAVLCSTSVFNSEVEEKIKEFISEIINADDEWWGEFEDVLHILNCSWIIDPLENEKIDDDFLFLHTPIIKTSINDGVLEKLIEFIGNYEIDDEFILEAIEDSLVWSLSNRVSEGGLDIDFQKYISWFDDGGTGDYEVDNDGIRSRLYECVEYMLDDYDKGGLHLLDSHSVITKVIDDADIESMIQSFNESLREDWKAEYYEYDDDRFASSDDVEAIFER